MKQFRVYKAPYVDGIFDLQGVLGFLGGHFFTELISLGINQNITCAGYSITRIS